MAESLVAPIVAALTAGALAVGKDTASQAAKDAYSSLKSLVKRRFEGKPEAEMALEQAEQEPETLEQPLLVKAVSEHAADAEIVALARQMLELLQDQQDSGSKYQVNIKNSQGIVTGDNAQVNQTFGNSSQINTDQPEQG